jgi:hypothetical protein
VVKLQHADVRFAAIDAWMRQQIVPNQLAVSLAVATLIYEPSLIVDLPVPAIMFFTVSALARSAIAATTFTVYRLRKTLSRERTTALWAVFHLQMVAAQCANCIAQCRGAAK